MGMSSRKSSKSSKSSESYSKYSKQFKKGKKLKQVAIKKYSQQGRTLKVINNIPNKSSLRQTKYTLSKSNFRKGFTNPKYDPSKLPNFLTGKLGTRKTTNGPVTALEGKRYKGPSP